MTQTPLTVNSARVAQQFSDAAKRYDAEAALQWRIMQHAFGFAAEHFPNGAHVLDVGAGTGFFAKHATEQGKNWQMDGLDIAQGMCKASAEHYRHMFCASMMAMPLNQGEYGGIFSSLAVQWAGDVKALWQEFSRVLAPGGVAVVASFAPGTLQELDKAGEMAGVQGLVMPMVPAQNHQNAMQLAGFEALTITQETITETRPDVKSLIQHLRAIGATNANGQEKRRLSPEERSKMMAAYAQHFSNPQGQIITSWCPIYLVAKKQ